MKFTQSCIRGLLPFVFVVAFNPVVADELFNPVAITAEEAFDSVQRGVYPTTDDPANVVLIDVRAPLEVFSSGAAAAVESLRYTRGRYEVEVQPDSGKANLIRNGRSLEYQENGRRRLLNVDRIESLVTVPIAYNIRVWDQSETGLDTQPEALQAAAETFAEKLNGLVDKLQPEAVILYCRTGGRSSFAGQLILNGEYTFRDHTYEAEIDSPSYEVYEIDDPSGVSGRGGFSGADYGKVFNGYAGFPARVTGRQEIPSASWEDSGLPVVRAVLDPPE